MGPRLEQGRPGSFERYLARLLLAVLPLARSGKRPAGPAFEPTPLCLLQRTLLTLAQEFIFKHGKDKFV